MGEIHTNRYERVARREFEKCPNCGEFKYATIQYFEYDSFWKSLLDIHGLRLYGEWKDHRKMCDWCGKREKL